MTDLAMEERHLAIAERDLAQGEQRVTRQAALVEAMRREGRSTPQAEALLVLLRATLAGWHDHRNQIVRAIAQIKAAEAAEAARERR